MAKYRDEEDELDDEEDRYFSRLEDEEDAYLADLFDAPEVIDWLYLRNSDFKLLSPLPISVLGG